MPDSESSVYLEKNAHQPLLLTDRVAVVTGASSGIGEAIVKDLALNGARVVANARSKENLAALENDLNTDDILVKALAGDASEQGVVDSMLDQALKSFGRDADAVIVNAGRGLSGSILTSNPDEWEEMIRINVLGCMRLMRSAAERMLKIIERNDSKQRKLDIVVIGSNVGRHISPFSSAYGATKFAVNSSAEAMRRELGPKGIRVSLVEPGVVETGFQKVAGYDQKWFDEFAGRIGPVLNSEDVARVVTFMISQPPNVHVNNIVVRPTRQDYP